MSAADCELCEWMGYRTCDGCGNVAFERGPLGIDLCGYCQGDEGDEEESDLVRIVELPPWDGS
jgi:hypothetical protein